MNIQSTLKPLQLSEREPSVFPDSATSQALIQSLSRKIDEVLTPLVPPGSRCALLGFPNHGNVGDNAIWLGEKAWLRRQNVTIVYSCEATTYSRRELAATVGRGIIFLTGGGSVGDLYPHTQAFREQVLLDFPHNPIIQFPQSVYFQHAEHVKRAQDVFNRHANFTLLARTQRSFDRACNLFNVESALCPDMAFALGPIDRPSAPRTKILWLLRLDGEVHNTWKPFESQHSERTDWLSETPTMLHRMNRMLTRDLKLSQWLGRLDAWLPGTYDLLAQNRLRWGCHILSRGRLVVTDRLHGHILSLLLGIPHVLLDNSYGKVRAFYETWTTASELTRWADSPEEAVAIAKSFISGHHGNSDE